MNPSATRPTKQVNAQPTLELQLVPEPLWRRSALQSYYPASTWKPPDKMS